MATAKITLTGTPQKIVDANTEFFLQVAASTRVSARLATTDTPGSAPTGDAYFTLRGDQLQEMSRALLSSSLEVWAWSPDGTIDLMLEAG